MNLALTTTYVLGSANNSNTLGKPQFSEILSEVPCEKISLKYSMVFQDPESKKDKLENFF